jgi:hypothetical protein
VRNAVPTRHYSRRTEKAYVHWIKRYIFFHGKRDPAEMGGPEVTTFLTSLAVHGKVAASTQNQALSALLFLYRDVLEVELPWLDDVVRAKRPVHLPVVLTRDEVRAVLQRLDGVPRLMALLLRQISATALAGWSCPAPFSASTRTPAASGAGNGSPLPRACTSSASAASSADTIFTNPHSSERRRMPSAPPGSPSRRRATRSATIPRAGLSRLGAPRERGRRRGRELSPDLLKRMDDRRFTELDLRRMLERAAGYCPDVVESRWVIETRHRRRPWEVIVEPDRERQLLVVVTAYPVWE